MLNLFWNVAISVQARGHLDFLCRMKDYLPRSNFINGTIHVLGNHFYVKPIEMEAVESPSNTIFKTTSRLLRKQELEEAAVNLQPECISQPAWLLNQFMTSVSHPIELLISKVNWFLQIVFQFYKVHFSLYIAFLQGSSSSVSLSPFLNLVCS